MGALSLPEIYKSTCISLSEGAKPCDIAKGQNFCPTVLTWMHVTVSECAVMRAVLLSVL